MRILYPTDFSETALNAFRYALHLAQSTNGAIVTFHAYSLPEMRGTTLSHTLREIYSTISLEEFEDYKDTIPVLREMAEKSGVGIISMTHVMHEGKPKQGILSAICANRPDIVVMGTTGAGMMQKMLIGSVAAGVMEEADVPVMVVPATATFKRPVKKIAFAAEHLPDDGLAIGKLRKIAQYFGARIICVHIDVSHTTKDSGKPAMFRETYPDIELQILDGSDAESSIKTFIRDHEIDLLSTIIHKRSRFQELLTYSLTKKLARQLDVPILAIQSHAL